METAKKAETLEELQHTTRLTPKVEITQGATIYEQGKAVILFHFFGDKTTKVRKRNYSKHSPNLTCS